MLPILSVFLIIYVAAAAASNEYHYMYGSERIRTNVTRPVTFGGVIIGTTELNKTATPGTAHALSAGHHFRHEDWYLTDADGGSWEYLPNLRADRLRGGVQKRQASADFTFTAMGTTLLHETLHSVGTTAFAFASTESEISWQWVTAVSGEALDLIDSGSVVASSTALVGDLVDIFFNALEIFL
ncbi:hypothetical protein F5884DRAFT_756905 [Xylogone sp. PMI_703]|nr:hypothetical protein F5884DRAFT_756905 [Xylogone sp. PMI_703]